MKATTILVLAVAAAMILGGCQKKPPAQAVSVKVEERPAVDLTPESTATLTDRTPREPRTDVTLRTSTDTSGQGTVKPPRTYTVQKGDTLYSIARKLYGDQKRYKDIVQANGLADPNKIAAGQVLKIPD